MKINRNKLRLKRKRRVRAKIIGSSARPRLSVFKSLKGISVQAIDDASGKTIVSASFREIKQGKNNIETAKQVGELMAKKLIRLKIKEISFDRGGYKYHGKIKALAEGARKGGLKF